MFIRPYWPAYRFPLAYVAGGRILGYCQVEVFAEGLAQPTVVLTDLPGDYGRSVTNAIEVVCEHVRRLYLKPLKIKAKNVRWVQHLTGSSPDEWVEVTFTAKGKPKWTSTEAVVFDWDQLLPTQYERTARRLLAPGDVDLADLHLTAGECHQVKTGICSLEAGAYEDNDEGDAGYAHCRRLALWAEVWNLIREFCGGDLPGEPGQRDSILRSPALAAHIREHWSGRYGELHLEVAVPRAVALYGGYTPGEAIDALDVGGNRLQLGDGQHRICVAAHLAIPVGGRVSWVEQRPP